MFFKVIVLKKFANFTGKHLCQSCMPSELQLYLKRTPTQVFSSEICEVFNNNLLSRTSPVDTSDSFRFPACNFIKTETPAMMFSCEFCKLFKNILWQKVFGWLLLVFISEFWGSFSEHLSYRPHPGNCYVLCTMYYVQVAEFQPPDTVFHRCFSSILYKNKSRYPKALTYLKSLKILYGEINR